MVDRLIFALLVVFAGGLFIGTFVSLLTILVIAGV